MRRPGRVFQAAPQRRAFIVNSRFWLFPFGELECPRFGLDRTEPASLAECQEPAAYHLGQSPSVLVPRTSVVPFREVVVEDDSDCWFLGRDWLASLSAQYCEGPDSHRICPTPCLRSRGSVLRADDVASSRIRVSCAEGPPLQTAEAHAATGNADEARSRRFPKGGSPAHRVVCSWTPSRCSRKRDIREPPRRRWRGSNGGRAKSRSSQPRSSLP